MIAGVKATKPSTILIVEDDPMMQLGLSRLLATEPQFTIVGQVEDGNSAIDVASKLKPDIILMDIGLPDIDGIAAASQIKALLPHTRILMLTSHTSDTEVLASLSCGTEGYCIKGTSTEQLLTALNAVREGSTYLDAKIATCVIQNLRKPTTNCEESLFTARELTVLKLMAEGKSNKDIGYQLHLSPNTIKGYIKAIFNKMETNDRVQAAVIALRSGLV